MSNDIVARLREEGFITHMAKLPRESKILHAAADEIEQLRKERDEARREAMSWIIDQACRFEDVDKEYKRRGWEYLKEITNE